VTDQDLDLSGFRAQRKVDVPPPSKKKTPPGSGKPKSGTPKAKSAETGAAQGDASPLDPQVGEPGPQPAQVESHHPILSPRTAGRSTSGRKKRVNVSLPVELSQRFTEQAAQEDRYLTDMVLDSYRNHFAEIRAEYIAEQGEADLPFRPRRRKAATGRVTHMLYLAAPEIAVIDESALEVGRSRSELVSQLLERELR